MGHSDIGVTMNTYTHLGLEDAVDEMNRMQQLESARKKQEALSGKTDEVKAFEEAFPGRMTGKNDDADWNESSRFFIARVFFLWYSISRKKRFPVCSGIPCLGALCKSRDVRIRGPAYQKVRQ